MKVFISWSGAASLDVAQALHWWLPKVIQSVRPFVSSKDINKGANWNAVLAQELETTDFGVVCLNAENLTSPWLNYEAGAITRSVESRVCPVLHGLDKSDVKPPLGQLQLTSLDHDDVLLMMRSMNAVVQMVDGTGLSEVDLNEAFGVRWPQLQERIKPPPTFVSLDRAGEEPEQPESSDKELLTELLQLVREMQPTAQSLSKFQLVGTPPHPGALARLLHDSGLPVREVTLAPKVTTVRVRTVPTPLPDKVRDLLKDYEREAQADLRVESDDGGTIDLAPLPWDDEPPF